MALGERTTFPVVVSASGQRDGGRGHDTARTVVSTRPATPGGPVVRVRAATPDDAGAIAALHDAVWGGPLVAGHDTLADLSTLPTLVALDAAGRIVGALAYHLGTDELEVVSIAADPPRTGAGTALLAAATDEARGRRLSRLWLVTTNDNLDALRFYQRQGLRIVHVDPGAVDRARRLKPGIPLVGAYGIAMHDELHLERRLEPSGGVARYGPGVASC